MYRKTSELGRGRVIPTGKLVDLTSDSLKRGSADDSYSRDAIKEVRVTTVCHVTSCDHAPS